MSKPPFVTPVDDDLDFVDDVAPAPPPAVRPPAREPQGPPDYSMTVLPPRHAKSGFVFVPNWDAFHKILSTYVCVPVAPSAGPRGVAFGHDILPKDTGDLERAEFDKRSFQHVVETAGALEKQKNPVLLSFCM